MTPSLVGHHSRDSSLLFHLLALQLLNRITKQPAWAGRTDLWRSKQPAVSQGGRGPGTVLSGVFRVACGDSVRTQLSHLRLLCFLPPSLPKCFCVACTQRKTSAKNCQTLNQMSPPLWCGSESECSTELCFCRYYFSLKPAQKFSRKFTSLCFVFKYFFKSPPAKISDGENEVGKPEAKLQRRHRAGFWGSTVL